MDRGPWLAPDAVNTIVFVLGAIFVAYVALLIVPMFRRRPDLAGDERDFDWHFLIPCLNEDAVIAETVRRLIGQFPDAGVWCIDDGSDDATPDVLAGLAAEFDEVRVVTRTAPEARTGKGPALNAGWYALVAGLPADVDTARVVVGVVDADGRLDGECLNVVSGPDFLGNPSVGAVQVKVRVVDRSAVGVPGPSRRQRLLVRLQDLEFSSVIAAMQTLRRHLGIAGMGGNGQFTRLEVLNRIATDYGTPWHRSLIEDFELGLHVLLIGYRNQYCHDTWVEQEGLLTFSRLVRQRSRWGQGNMDCWSYFGQVLRSRHISTPGALEISYFLLLPWIQLVGSLLYLAAAALLVYSAALTPGGPLAWFGAGAWGILPLLLIFGIGPLAVWGPLYRRFTDPTMSRRSALALGLCNWPYTFVHTVATWWAFSRIVRSRHDWKKTERSAPLPVPLPSVSPVPLPAFVTPTISVAAAPSNLVAGTFARTHQRRIEYRRTTAVGRFRPHASTAPSSHIERIKSHVPTP